MLNLIFKLQLVQQIIIVDRVFMVVVAQMVRATDCGAVVIGFICATGARWRSQGLIKQIRKNGSYFLECDCLIVRKIIGDDIEVGLLSVQSRLCDPQRTNHYFLPQPLITL